MKKVFLFAAAMVAAISMNAATIAFTEADTTGVLNGKTIGAEPLVLSITDTNTTPKITVDKNATKFGDAEGYWQSEFRLKTGGKSGSANSLKLTIGEEGTLYIYARTGSNTATNRNLVLTQGTDTIFNEIMLETNSIKVQEKEGEVTVYNIFEVNVKAGEVNVTYPVGSINFYGFGLNEKLGDTATAVENAEAEVKAVKTIENGQLVIIKNGVRYNAAGAAM